MMFAITALLPGRMGWGGPLEGWRWRSRIGFPGYTRGETLTNVPMLVTFGGHIPNFRYDQFREPLGADLRFLASDGVTILPHETETWDTQGVSCVWVRLPELTNAGTFAWAYWGRAGAGAPESLTNGAVWSNACEAVWHLSEASGAHADWSRRGYTASPYNAPQQGVAGLIGGCDRFSGTAYLSCGNKPGTVISDPTGRDLTFSCWVRPGNLAGPGYVFSSGGQTTSRGIGMSLDASEVAGFMVRNATNGIATGYVMPLGQGEWVHVAMVYQQGTSTLRLYRNGTNFGEYAAGAMTQSDAQTAVTLGKPNNVNNYYFDGSIDEARFATEARSSNWIWACWASQVSNTMFCSFGPATPIAQGAVFTFR